MFWQNPKDPDVKDRYGATVDPKWLDGEIITSATFTAVGLDSGLVISGVNIADNQTSAYFENGTIGFHPILIRIETPTRQMERTSVLWVKES